MAQTEFLTLQSDFDVRGKKEEIWLIPLTKSTTPTEKSKKQCENTKHHQKLRLPNDCGLTTGVVKLVYRIPTFQLTTKTVLSKGHTFKKIVNNPPNEEK